MRSSISSFDLAAIAKMFGTAAATILLAWAVIPDRLPFDREIAFGAETQNALIAEQYTYEHLRKPVVLLGSSILSMIPPANCRPDNVASIFLQGRSAMSGLEVIRRVGARPQVVFVEVPTLHIGVDSNLMREVFPPIYWRISSVIPPLRHNRNWVVLLYRWKIQESRPPRFSIETPTQSIAEWNEQMAPRIAPFLQESGNDSGIQRIVPDLTARVRELQQRGAQVIFFDPIDPRLREVWPDKNLRPALRAALPDVEIVDAPDDKMPFFRWEGLHLYYSADGLRFFLYLMNHAGLPATSKCELIFPVTNRQ